MDDIKAAPPEKRRKDARNVMLIMSRFFAMFFLLRGEMKFRIRIERA